MTEYKFCGSSDSHHFIVPTTSSWTSSYNIVGSNVVNENDSNNFKTLDETAIPSLRFPQKLWRIVNECNNGAISWGSNGQTIKLSYKCFQDEYLSANATIFKTSNIASFIRQLNLYGFRKLASSSSSSVNSCTSTNDNSHQQEPDDVHEFVHEYFREGRLDLLSRVCRKTGVKKNNAIKKKIEIPETMTFVAEQQQLINPDVDIVTTTTTIKEEVMEQADERPTRLRKCQIALTRALEQATLQYQREKLLLQLANANNLRETFQPKFEPATFDDNVEIVFQDDLDSGDNFQVVEYPLIDNIVNYEDKNQWQEVLNLSNSGTISISMPY